jgi:fibronectin type III domain protein
MRDQPLYPPIRNSPFWIEILIRDSGSVNLMIMKSISLLLVAASLSTAFAMSSADASCDDRPGTPDDVKADTVSSTSIRFGWRNTTSRSSTGAYSYYFDISVSDGSGQQVGQDLTGFGPYSVAYRDRSSHDFNGLTPNTKYCFSIRARTEGGTQGCVSEISSATVCATTSAPPGVPADTCISGYVWRNVTSTDHVCVEPRVRDQVRADDRLAKDRTVPSTRAEQVCLPGVRCQEENLPCKPGFVWRDAVPGDTVCVEVRTRDQAYADNANAAQRRVVAAGTTPTLPPPPPAPTILVSVPQSQTFLVQGHGFLSGHEVTVRVADDALNPNLYYETVSNASGSISAPLPIPCHPGRLYFSAIDGRRNTAEDLTNRLWSNTVAVSCQ